MEDPLILMIVSLEDLIFNKIQFTLILYGLDKVPNCTFVCAHSAFSSVTEGCTAGHTVIFPSFHEERFSMFWFFVCFVLFVCVF